jgi:hypothetical protein
MLKDTVVHDCDIVVDLPGGSIISTLRVIHCDNYNGKAMRGTLKTFCVARRVACGGGIFASVINPMHYIES